MAMSPNTKDREHDKFQENPGDLGTDVRVVIKAIDSGSITILGDSITSGTVDGTSTGIERTFVNNRKNQVLASHDLAVAYTWLDFGTKDERVSTIVYTSATFVGVTVTRTFAYSLVGTKYRLNSETWVTAPGGQNIMADFGLEGEFAPDSDLDSDNSQLASVVLNDGTSCEVWKNDWIDAAEGTVPPDPWWGLAFQISKIEDGNIFIKMMNSEGEYEEIGFSPSLITNVFRHVEKS